MLWLCDRTKELKSVKGDTVLNIKKKIIEVSTDTNIGGAGKCLITLVKNFDREKFNLEVILPPNSLLKPFMFD